MLNRTTFLLVATLATATASAQVDGPKRTIEVAIAGTAKGDTIYLANYYGNKLYYADTAIADAKGTVAFKRAKGYAAGVYAVVVPGPKYFELLVNEPLIKLATRKEDLLANLQVKQSKENELFIGYIRYLNERKVEGDAYRAQLEAAKDEAARKEAKGRMEALDKTVKKYQRDLVAGNPGTLAATLVRMSMAVEELPEPRRPDGSIDSSAVYYQYRAHYWDNVDFTDERIVRIPVFANKFDEYMGKVVPQIPDTINRLVDDLVARTGSAHEVFKYVVHNVTHRYETSEIMGMDAVFVHMALTYYCPKAGMPGRVDWMEADKLEKLCERARKMSPLVLGRKAPNIILTDSTEQKWVDFYSLPQDYVVIIFWDPHCGHCKKELPEIYKTYQEKLKPMGIEVFAVAKAVDESLMTDWKKFIRENKLDWVNVALTKNVFEEAKKDARKFIPKYTTIESLNYADTYDVFSTPKLFVVDRDRKFVGKSLTADQIADLVTKLRERKAR
jgi:thiol-disulfide isomerase/thioredoxin